MSEVSFIFIFYGRFGSQLTSFGFFFLLSILAEHRKVVGWLQLVGPSNYRSLLQNIVSFIGLFCEKDLSL